MKWLFFSSAIKAFGDTAGRAEQSAKEVLRQNTPNGAEGDELRQSFGMGVRSSEKNPETPAAARVAITVHDNCARSHARRRAEGIILKKKMQIFYWHLPLN